MKTRVCATALVLLAGTAQAMAANNESAANVSQGEMTLAAAAPVAAPAPAPAAAQPGDDAKGSQPPIVVHKDQTAADTRDGRVDMGDGVKVSMGWGVGGSAVSPSGLIHVPSNTLGPGEALWRADDRQDAQIKLATAAADIARTEAQRPNTYDRYDSGYGPFGVFNWFGGGYGGFGGFAPASFVQTHGGPGAQPPERGPGSAPAGGRRASSILTPSNAIGSTVQMAFAAAAYPRLGAAQDARDAGLTRFTKDATPQISATQNAVDQAHTNASTEHAAR